MAYAVMDIREGGSYGGVVSLHDDPREAEEALRAHVAYQDHPRGAIVSAMWCLAEVGDDAAPGARVRYDRLRGPGRPADARQQRIWVRLSDDELATLERAAAVDSRSVTDYVRAEALRAARTTPEKG